MVITALARAAVVAAVSVTVAFAGPALAQQPRVLKVQSAVPPATTTQDALKFFADRVDKLTGGQLKIEALPGGAIVRSTLVAIVISRIGCSLGRPYLASS